MPKKNLPSKQENLSEWYTQVIQLAQFADYAPVKGCMVIRPNGYEIWERIQQTLDPKLKALGVRNAYFPLFIPMSFLQKEAQHVEGFAPELAVVTHGGGEELQEKLVVRPTSETIMYAMYSKWIQSHRDLPMSLNQWNNVVRWEKRTYLFLRTMEFLWQEAHTAHADHTESWQMVLDGLESYRQVLEEELAIPVIKGRKSDSERFAGALVTTTVEALMPDGKALQAGTSHDLGQNFAKPEAFNIAFQNAQGKTDYAWQTSYGLTTRTIGALIMTHGDDDGIVLPPRVAPIQVMIVPANMEDDHILEHAELLRTTLTAQHVRVSIDARANNSMGWKLNDAELQGVPLTLVVGKREMDAAVYEVKVRFTKTKEIVTLADLSDAIPALLTKTQDAMFAAAEKRRDEMTTVAESYEQFKQVMSTKRGFIRAFWCESAQCETEIKTETKATTRCLPFIDHHGKVAEEKGVCVRCGQPAVHQWLFAQAY